MSAPGSAYFHRLLAEASSDPLRVIAGAPDKPLVIGDIEIQCYVLEDETRVLTQRGVYASLGATRGGYDGAAGDGAEIPRFASRKWLNPFIPKDLDLALKTPIRFQPPGAPVAFGYPATILVDLCAAIVQADRHGATTDRQKPIVDRAYLLQHGFSTVGIIALIDEAAGYQDIRSKRALATILEKFIATEMQPWTRTFPFEFYESIARLRNWPDEFALRRPSVVGHYTNDLVYARLAPGLLDELKTMNPTLPRGGRRSKHHQWFTPEFGHPKLKEHLAGVMALMRAAGTWNTFKLHLDLAFPKQTDLNLRLDYRE